MGLKAGLMGIAPRELRVDKIRPKWDWKAMFLAVAGIAFAG